jgi:putative selenium metabolism hydrolase
MNDFIKDCQEVIRIPSESGQEEAVAGFFKARMESLGYDRAWIDEKGNVLGLIEGNTNRTIMLEGHMDTVGVSDPKAWTVDPFGGIVDNGRIYGRGTSDMKCALMGMVYGAADLIAQKKLLGGRVLVAGTVCEEEFEGVAQGHILDQITPDLVIIGEASELMVKIGQRGRAEVVIETHGKSAHSSNPSAGINAIKKMTQLLSAIDFMALAEDDLLGPAIIEVTDIRSEPYPGASVIPSYCRATLDRRTLPGETEEMVLASIQKIIDDLAVRDPEFSGQVYLAQATQRCYTGNLIEAKRFFPAWRFEAETPFVQNALSALEIAGISTGISFYSFCTNGSQSAGFRGIPTLGFGPSRENLAHVADEYVEIDQLEKARIGYRVIAANALAGF